MGVKIKQVHFIAKAKKLLTAVKVPHSFLLYSSQSEFLGKVEHILKAVFSF